MVTIKADRAGLQLAEVRRRPRQRRARRPGALDLPGRRGGRRSGSALEAGRGPRDPRATSTVEILPTTLFGQKYISFVRPERARPARASHDGDVIPADRVETNVELSRILASLFPLLRSVRPADLNATLNALATALGGRGEQLGETLDKLDSYLGAIDDAPADPAQGPGRCWPRSADTYDVAAPDLLGVLGNVTVTSRTVIDQRQELDVFFGDLSRPGRHLDPDPRRQRDQPDPGRRSSPSRCTGLLAVYSPEYPCLLKGLAATSRAWRRSSEGNMIRQYFVFGTPQYREYDRARPPGVRRGRPRAVVPGPARPARADRAAAAQRRHATRTTTRRTSTDPAPAGPDAPPAGTPAPRATRRSSTPCWRRRSGRPADSYGSLGSLMYGPVVRGGEAAA